MLYIAMILFAITVAAGLRYMTVDMYLAHQAHEQFMWALGLFVATLVIGLIRRR